MRVMPRNRPLTAIASAVAIATFALVLRAQAPDPTFTSRFDEEKADLATTGRNPYFILEPGYSLTLEGGDVRLVITVLNDTKLVDGVQTRIVEERETEKGEPVE